MEVDKLLKIQQNKIILSLKLSTAFNNLSLIISNVTNHILGLLLYIIEFISGLSFINNPRNKCNWHNILISYQILPPTIIMNHTDLYFLLFENEIDINFKISK